MTDLFALPNPINLWQPPTLEIHPNQPSVLGRIMETASRCKSDPLCEFTPCDFAHDFRYTPITPSTATFLRGMDKILRHIESKVRAAGWLQPLDFEADDFDNLLNGDLKTLEFECSELEDFFDDFPTKGEACLAFFTALKQWYRAIYVRQRHVELFWRDLYEDKTPLTKQQEATYFAAMRNGSADAARWRDLFIHRNMGLVGHWAKYYTSTLASMKLLNEKRFWTDERGQDHDGGASIAFEARKKAYEELVAAGRIGLAKAVDKFKPELGYKFSTPAVKWIRGEMTALFKEGQKEDEERFTPIEEDPDAYRPVKGYFVNAVGAALTRLQDERKAQIITLRWGLGGKPEHTFEAIASTLGITRQRVYAVHKKTIEQLKKDTLLRSRWFNSVFKRERTWQQQLLTEF